jgi:hypothetical protein
MSLLILVVASLLTTVPCILLSAIDRPRAHTRRMRFLAFPCRWP